MMERQITFGYGCMFSSYWMLYAPLCTFASVFLLGKGYSNAEIGVAISLANVFAMLLESLLADLADHSERFTPLRIAKLMVLFMMLVTALLFVFTQRSRALYLVYIILLACHPIMLPLFNAMPFRFARIGISVNFGLCRGLGSAAYTVLGFFFGNIVDRCGLIAVPVASEILLALVFGSIAYTTMSFEKAKEARRKADEAQEGTGTGSAEERPRARSASDSAQAFSMADFVKGNPYFLILCLFILIMYFHHQIINYFLLQMIRPIGGDSVDMSRIYSFMTLMELPCMFGFNKLRRRFSSVTLLRVSFAAFAAKSILVYFSHAVWMIYAAHILHIFAFGLFTPAFVYFINEIMSRGEAVKGQALYTMTITAAAVIGNPIGGLILDQYGASALNLFSAVTCTIGAALSIVMVARVKQRAERVLKDRMARGIY